MFIVGVNLTKETLQPLYDKEHNFAAIAGDLNCSRELIRQKANEFGIQATCRKCGADVETFRQGYCPDCRRKKRREDYNRWLKKSRKPRDYGERPAVQEAISFYEGCGLTVSVDGDSDRGSPELIVSGEAKTVKVKVYALTRFSMGFQTRLQPADGADFYYMSNCNGVVYVIPSHEIQSPQNYIGCRSPLREYGETGWIDNVVQYIENGSDLVG